MQGCQRYSPVRRHLRRMKMAITSRNNNVLIIWAILAEMWALDQALSCRSWVDFDEIKGKFTIFLPPAAPTAGPPHQPGGGTRTAGSARIRVSARVCSPIYFPICWRYGLVVLADVYIVVFCYRCTPLSISYTIIAFACLSKSLEDRASGRNSLEMRLRVPK